MSRRVVALVLAALLGAPAGAAPSHALPDPTRPPLSHRDAMRRLDPASLREFRVSAIRIGGDRRWALVNGQLVAEGDAVDDARVIEIRADGVVLEYLSQRTRVALLPRTIRQPVAGR